ncbi:unnamed protein product [Somion occarium]|uniref:Uncharacterized protein n=1 Tax=Somion occarium TaxID=3059160 RepID=A0ABP1DQK7_9APHY
MLGCNEIVGRLRRNFQKKRPRFFATSREIRSTSRIQTVPYNVAVPSQDCQDWMSAPAKRSNVPGQFAIYRASGPIRCRHVTFFRHSIRTDRLYVGFLSLSTYVASAPSRGSFKVSSNDVNDLNRQPSPRLHFHLFNTAHEGTNRLQCYENQFPISSYLRRFWAMVPTHASFCVRKKCIGENVSLVVLSECRA